MHRILEILIKADSLAGMIEGNASKDRAEGYLPSPFTNDVWLKKLSTNDYLAGGIEREPHSKIERGEISSAFLEILTDKTSIIDSTTGLADETYGFVQYDVESNKKVLFLRVDKVLGYLTNKLGELPKDPEEYVTGILASDHLIHNPLSVKEGFNNWWNWRLNAYFKSKILIKNSDGLDVLCGKFLGEPNAEVKPLYFYIDLARIADICDVSRLPFKHHEKFYYLIAGSAGQGFTSPWVTYSAQLVEARRVILIADGGDIGKYDSSSLSKAAQVATKEEYAEEDSDDVASEIAPDEQEDYSSESDLDVYDDTDDGLNVEPDDSDSALNMFHGNNKAKPSLPGKIVIEGEDDFATK
jgi:hypothetical protein